MSLKPELQPQAIAVMKTIPLFAGLSDALLQQMAAQLEPRSVTRGKVVLMEQEISKTLYILMKGSVSVTRRALNQKMAVATLLAPNVFGEVSMFSDSAVTALVKTESDSVFLTLTKDRFDALTQQFADLLPTLETNRLQLAAQRPTAPKKLGE